MSVGRNLFVYVIVGDAHVSRLNNSLEFLKHFTKSEIVVVAARSSAPIQHEQILRPAVPERYDDHQATIFLKTNLHRLLAKPQFSCCYLDTDVIAVDAGAGEIFSRKRGPVTFAPDHSRLAEFSRFAVRCACMGGECNHLVESIQEKFGIEVADPNWQHWNGGVFLFDAESTDVLDTWHEFACAIFDDPFWRTRDQGTLVATVWKYGLQHQPTLDREFNYIVDAMYDAEDSERAGILPTSYHVHADYSLNGEEHLAHPYFLHLIGGFGAKGWKNWDDAAQHLARSKKTSDRGT